jgi:hypothetical protein
MKIRTSLLLLLISITQITAFAQVEDWTTPIGIPVPSFGINETYRMYDDAAKRTASGLPYQASAGGGYFTHYVDANTAGATDSGNTYGTIKQPRLTIPSTLPAGSVVEVHTTASYASYTNVQGTEALPVFIRGVDTPTMTSGMSMYGSYCIIEGLYFYKKSVYFSTNGTTVPQYICFRNNEIKGDGTFANTGTGIGINGSNTYGLYTHDIVIYNNEISYLGQWNATSENDTHSIKSDHHTRNIWILNNHLHHCGGDSVQVGFNGDEATWEARGAHYIYIAANICHDNYEDGFDIKTSSHVICSQNTVYNMVNGGGMFLQANYDAQSGWFLFNRIYDCKTGINAAGAQFAYAIGNIVYNITREDNYGAIGIAGPSCGAFANILHNCPRPIKISNYGSSGPTSCTVSNNIVSEMKPIASYSENYLEDWTTSSSVIDANDNIFYKSDGDPKIRWNGTTYTSIAAWQSATGKGNGCIDRDPLFNDPDNGDFSLKEGSPINNLQTSSQAQAVYDRFLQLYGVDLAADIAGKERTLYVPPSVPVNTDTGNTNSSSEDVLPGNTDTSSTDSGNVDILSDNSIDTGSTQETQDSSPVVTNTANQVPQSSGTESNNTATNNTSDTTQATNTLPITSTSQTTGTTQITGTTQVSNSGTHDNSRRSRMTGFITTKVTPKKIFGRYDDIYNTAKRGWTVKKEYFE